MAELLVAPDDPRRPDVVAVLETGSQEAFAPARALYAAAGFEPCGPFGSYEDVPTSAFFTRVV